MSFKFSDLWKCEGTIGNSGYAIAGFILVAIKYNIDKWVTRACFDYEWNVYSYWIPSPSFRIDNIPQNGLTLYLTLLGLSLPFVWIGVCLTLKRLRSTCLPLTLVLFFFVPLINLLFFLLLCVLPARGDSSSTLTPRKRSWLDRLLPESKLGSALVGALITALCAVILAIFSTQFLRNYGWGLFVGIPFAQGFVSVLIYSRNEPVGYSESLGVAALSVALVAGLLLAFAIEGIICIAMAAPIAGFLALLGGGLAYSLQTIRHLSTNRTSLSILMFLGTAGLIWGEKEVRGPTPLIEVKTSVMVNAPPERVWRHVVSFTELPPPSEWLFQSGIAYPTKAEIEGRGPGALRLCIFSTGSFVEPITVWDEPRLLQFTVESNPPPMEEISFYDELHPPHLEGFLVSRKGQFHLIPLPGGKTLLEGTTWYEHNLWPAAYWTLWSDQVIHKIHHRVLKHVKELAERDAA
jgi:hypothetical protein